MAKIIGNTTTTSYPRPDWNQSDATKPDFIKNRTHYVNRVKKGITLTADTSYEYDKDGKHYYTCVYIGWSDVNLSDIGTVYVDGVECQTGDEQMVLPNGRKLWWGALFFDEDEKPIKWEYGSDEDDSLEPFDDAGLYIYWFEEDSVVPLDDKFIPDTVERNTNKINILDLDNPSRYDDSGEYPTAFAVANAIIQNGTGVEQSAILMAEGYTNHKVGELADKVNSEKENKTNKVAELSEDSTDEQYPSAKAVFDLASQLKQEIKDEIDGDMSYAGDAESVLLGKEDKFNKVTTISSSSTDEQYPSAKAVNDRIVAKADWELVEDKNLEENVTEIVLNLPRSYKQLFWVFKVPTINPDKTSNFPKGRMALYSNGNQIVAFDPDYGITDTGNEWYLSYHMQMLGEHCSVFKTCKDPATQITESAYIQYPPFYQKDVGWQPGKDIGSKGMYYLKLTMMCQTTGARYFPAGTKYELWGVRA